jgi:hypothetical protein
VRLIRCVARLAPVAMALIAFGSMAPASAADPDAAFTVANYPVEASAPNAVAAKDQALSDGQQAAFRSLLKRLVPVTAYKQLSRVSGTKAANLVSGMSVRSERNSATTYIGSFDFAFDPDGVRSLLSGQSIPFVDKQAPAVTVVPALMQGNPPKATNDRGLWRRAWSGLDLSHTLTPVEIRDLSPAISNDVVNGLLSGDDGALRTLKSEYKAGLVIVAIAEPDVAAKKLTVTLAGNDAAGGILLKRTYRIFDGDLDYASQLAAVVSLGILEGRWKARKSGAAPETADQAAPSDTPVWAASTGGSGQDVTLTARFASSAQWDKIRSGLLDMPGVDALNIASVSDDSADITLKYPGGGQSLAAALATRGLTMSNVGGSWALRLR